MANENKGLSSLKEKVKERLDKEAAENPQFAERYAAEGKSLDECCSYLAGLAFQRAAGGNVSYIDPEELYGLAIHYYQEDEVEITEIPTGVGVDAAPAVELTPEQKAKAEEDALERYTERAVQKLAERDRERRRAEKERRKAGREQAVEINQAWEEASLF